VPYHEDAGRKWYDQVELGRWDQVLEAVEAYLDPFESTQGVYATSLCVACGPCVHWALMVAGILQFAKQFPCERGTAINVTQLCCRVPVRS
jgi:hypothetical protein